MGNIDKPGLEFARVDMDEAIDAMTRLDHETAILFCIKKNYETYMEAREEGNNGLAMRAMDCIVRSAQAMKTIDLD
jgi:hypothetical protein